MPAPELGLGCGRALFCLSRMVDSVLESVISVYVSVTTTAPNGDPGRLSIGADFSGTLLFSPLGVLDLGSGVEGGEGLGAGEG